MPNVKTQAELAARLVSAKADEREDLFSQHAALLDCNLAHQLKSIYDDCKDGDITRASDAAVVLTELARIVNEAEIHALAAWTAGMCALQIEGQSELAALRLGDAASRFLALDKPVMAASTQLARLHALAMLGRYDEALECGLQVRDTFLATDDLLSAGKAEQNLGNIYFRRDQYNEAEQLYREARAHYVSVNDEKQLAQIDVCLAMALTYQHRFNEAETFYEQAMARAQKNRMEIAQAAIECDLGCFALLQARYNQALDYLEKSRRRYAALGMTHESAIAELEMADAYLELNLAPEAEAIYSKVAPVFAELGMRAERARAVTGRGRANLLLNRVERARSLLHQARTLYAMEGNEAGEAMARLIEAQLDLAEGDFVAVVRLLERVESVFAQAGALSWLLLAGWLRGEAKRAQGKSQEAREILASVLRDAKTQGIPSLAQRCYTSLGLQAATERNIGTAKSYFNLAVDLTEQLRAPLPAEEFYTAFVSDKLTPYVELVRLCLEERVGQQIVEALGYVERAKSQALLHRLSGTVQTLAKPRDSFEAELFANLKAQHAELNWLYSQLNRSPDASHPRSASSTAHLREAAQEREAAVLEITRQLQQCGARPLFSVEKLDVDKLQRALGTDNALVEYFTLDNEVLAFVVTDTEVAVVRSLGSYAEVKSAISQLQFQLDSLRYGADRVRAHLAQLVGRANRYLGRLYDILLKPFEDKLADRRLLVVPHQALHYVPFNALFDGARYVIEKREICYAPSACVLLRCLEKQKRPLKSALLVGVADARTPRVGGEVETIAPLFASAVSLLNKDATLAALRDAAPHVDVLHLACHGQFRPDNPMFSSLRLADGWLTAHDAYALDLHCELVTLSACETGVNTVAAGDELMGLARGFFSAGTPSLLVSLWTVDDEATAMLMQDFYARLQTGDSPAAAIRKSQLQLMAHKPHPYFWSPFILMGRW